MPTREQLWNLIWDDPVQIAYWLGYKDMTQLHSQWLHDFLFEDKDQTLQSHRGSFKTTTLSLFFALSLLIHPDKTIMYMRKTDQNVSDICKQTQNILLSGCFQRMCQIIYGHDLRLGKNTQSEIDTNLHKGVGGQAQISGFGINASITGRHADIVVTDDIVTLKDRVSNAEREHTRSIYQELRNVRNRGGRFVNTGTPWSEHDAFELMGKQAPIKKYDCYTTGLITPEELSELRESMTPSLFAANYELKHIADENALFKQANWLPAEESESIYGGQAHIDAAYDGEDYTAYTILKRDGDRFIGFGKLWRKHVDQCLNEMEMYHTQFQAGTISEETNGDKGYLDKELKARGFSTKPYHEHQNKYMKIATILRKHWNTIYWIDETDPEYIQQILGYTEDAQHDDAPDSCASLLRSMTQGQQGINTGSFLRGGY